MSVFPKGLIPALFLFVFITGAPSQAGSLRWHLVSVTPAGRATEGILHSLGFEHLDQKAAAFEVIAAPAQLELIRRAGLDARVLIDNYGAYLAERNAQAARLAAAGEFATGSMGGYFSPEEILSFVDSLRYSLADSPIGDTTVVGLSIQQRPVWMVEFGGRSGEDVPEVFFNSLIHAREGLSVMSLLYFMRFLADNYTAADSVRWLLDNRKLFFVPVVNPDGYEINWRLYADNNEFGLWRKNARDNNKSGTLDGQDGVDLNRNFGYKWGYDNTGSTTTWTQDDFRGDSAFSEPESRVMRELISSSEFRVAINCHTYGNYLLKPWSYIAAETPDSATYNRLGALLVSASGYVHGNATSVLSYPANGEFTDWEYGDSTNGGIIAWTAEIGPRNSNQLLGFWPPADQIEPIAENALAIFFNAARAAGFWPRLELDSISPQEGLPRRVYVEFRVDNAGLSNTDEPFTITMRDLGRRGSAPGGVTLDSWEEYPVTSSLPVEFGPEVYEMTGTLVLEQQGLVVTTLPLTLTRNTTDISGDLDSSDRTDIFDLLAVLSVVSRGVPADDNPERYDLNSDGQLDIFDVLDMLARLRARH